MAAPKMKKIVINVGTGTAMKKDKNKNQTVAERLVHDYRPESGSPRRQAVNRFFQSTTRRPDRSSCDYARQRMYAFLEKLINVALPRTKDFRGISRKVVDDIGNATLGIKEHTIFPETADEDIRDVFGMSITLVSSAKNKKEGTAFFEMIGIPFKKEDVKEDKPKRK